MKWSIIKNDFLKNKVINIALLLFMMFSSSLAVVSVLMGTQTFTAISELYKEANPPHFLQMHKGDMDVEEVLSFLDNNNMVVYKQIVTMINIYGDNITIENNQDSKRLSALRLDIGLVKQNDLRDLLLNANHEKVVLEDGEIGIPVILKDMYDIKLGDKLILESSGIKKEFKITDFILDASMNSTMASSTRILLSDNDFIYLKDKINDLEYLIEAYFEETSSASNFQTIYENANMPQNGQAVTYSMIFLLSAITDIVTVFVLLLVSVLLIIVSFICVKFTIMASLEEDVREIGTMKAIGLNHKDIANIYSSKYKFLGILSVILGFIIALLTNSLFSNHITATFGNMSISMLAIVLAIFISILMYLLIRFYCNKVLKKLKKITVVSALVNGEGINNGKVKVRDNLNKVKKLSVNFAIGLRDAFYGFKSWIIVFSIVIISFLMIMIPVNLLNTFEDPEFITYMGSSLEDILIEVENGEDLISRKDSVIELLNSEDVKNYYEYKTIRVKTTNLDGILMNLEIDTGSNSGVGLQYLSGGAPTNNNEIAISYLNASEIGKKVGDKIELIVGEVTHEVNISGIYQDVTSGGKTAKSKYDFLNSNSIKYSFSVNLKDNSKVLEVANSWQEKLGTKITVDPMDEFINQTLGGVSNQLKSIVVGITIIGASLVMLISVLFLKLKLTKDSSQIATLKAIGFSNYDIQKQYMIKIGFITIVGLLAGCIFSIILGEPIINLALSLSGLGITYVKLIINPFMQYIVSPLLLFILIEIVTWVVLKSINKYNIMSMIKE